MKPQKQEVMREILEGAREIWDVGEEGFTGVQTGTGFALQSKRASLASSWELPADRVTGVVGGGRDGRPGQEAGKK